MPTVIAINGSPRKDGNTAKLLGEALAGADGAGASTEMVHLYDLDYKGCTSCFMCKRKNGKFFGKCAMRDGLTPVLERALSADALLIGSPIYLSDVTGMLRSCMERLVFPNISYDDFGSYFSGRLNLGFIYTMNVDRDRMHAENYDMLFAWHSRLRDVFGGRFEYIACNDTLQFDDYSQYAAEGFDEEHKAKVKAEQFPVDRERARSMGESLATQ